MIYLIMGKSATGKDTVLSRLLEQRELGLKKIVQYTTRPMKSTEQNGREYFFVSTDRLRELEDRGLVLEKRSYDTVYGTWYYFTCADEANFGGGDYILIGTLPVLASLKEHFGKEAVRSIYLYIDDGLMLQRALDRELRSDAPRYAELCRRFLSDAEDFAEEKLLDAGIDICIENIEINDTIEKIISFMRGK